MLLKTFILFFSTTFLTSYLIDIYLNVSRTKTSKLFTSDELKQFNGVHQEKLYLAILGIVFDVTKGAKYYGPGETYHSFIGQDNSKSFVTGEFSEKASDDVISLTNQDLRSLNHWVKFYKKEYTKIGKLIGRFYDNNGKRTPYGKEIKVLIKAAEQAQANDDLEKLKFPPCNIEWDAQKGSRVWCTRKSGGIERDWVGVPRQLYEVGAENHRCACIQQGSNVGNIKEYENCDPASDSCFIKT